LICIRKKRVSQNSHLDKTIHSVKLFKILQYLKNIISLQESISRISWIPYPFNPDIIWLSVWPRLSNPIPDCTYHPVKTAIHIKGNRDSNRWILKSCWNTSFSWIITNLAERMVISVWNIPRWTIYSQFNHFRRKHSRHPGWTVFTMCILWRNGILRIPASRFPSLKNKIVTTSHNPPRSVSVRITKIKLIGKRVSSAYHGVIDRWWHHLCL
jgi:hypothetical protein